MLRRSIAAALLLGLAGCGHPTSGGTAAATATGPGSAASANHAAGVQSVTAARTSAQTEFGLLSGGDFGGAWDLWSAAAKQKLTRADFVQLNTVCPPRKGVPTQITGLSEVDANTVQVVWSQGSGPSGTARLVYAGGTWAFQPDQTTFDGYAKRLAGHCA